MALGILEGNKIEITAEETSFAPGETIRGQIMLTLKNPKKANGLRIRFYGEYIRRQGKNSHTERIFEQTVKLGEAKEYSSGTSIYNFEIQIPMFSRTNSQKIQIGPLSLNLGHDPIPMAKWYLDASLDVGMELDVNKKMKISVIV